MKRTPVIALVALIFLATATTATAGIITFNVFLNGSRAVPADASTGPAALRLPLSTSLIQYR
jgi:hypothetical protein